MLPGDSAKVDLTGIVKTELYNAETGERLDSGTSPLIGEATITADKNQLQIGTTFNNSISIGVTVPEPGPKRFHVGVIGKIDKTWNPKAELYGQYDIPIKQWKKVKLLVPVRVEKTWAGRMANKCGGRSKLLIKHGSVKMAGLYLRQKRINFDWNKAH